MEQRHGALEALGDMISSKFWHGRRVFLTGHTGFKGSWLALWLARLGARTTGYSLPPPGMPNLYELADIHALVDSITGDVNDAARLKSALKNAQPEIVFHLAAQPLVRQGYAQPAATFATNVMGTVNLLEAIREVPSVRSVVVVTTDKCYQNREWVWGYRETDPLGGHDPYSASKAAAEIVASAYRSSFLDTAGITVATARAGNVIGGGDFAQDRLLPDFVRAVARGTDLEIRRPDAVRPWQFVLEPLRGYLELAERGFACEPGIADAWNFGPDEDSMRTVKEVIEGFAAACALRRPIGIRFGTDTTHPHEATLLKLDTSKARARLAWRPRLDFDATLALTSEWYRAWLEGADLRVLSEQQLDSYIDSGTPAG